MSEDVEMGPSEEEE
jgi:NAD-dependent DNA ligase